MKLKLVTPPQAEPVSLAEAKAFLRVTHDHEDEIIKASITAAREHCERYSGWAYVEQVWDLWLDRWPCGNTIELRKPPVQSIEYIKYFSADGTEHTLPPEDYELDDKSFIPRVVLKTGKSWPSVTLRETNGIQVQFKAGYPPVPAVPPDPEDPEDEGTPEDPAGNIPESKKLYIKLVVSVFHQYRDAESELKKALDVTNYMVSDRVWPL